MINMWCMEGIFARLNLIKKQHADQNIRITNPLSAYAHAPKYSNPHMYQYHIFFFWEHVWVSYPILRLYHVESWGYIRLILILFMYVYILFICSVHDVSYPRFPFKDFRIHVPMFCRVHLLCPSLCNIA